jgi:hypothetical protein
MSINNNYKKRQPTLTELVTHSEGNILVHLTPVDLLPFRWFELKVNPVKPANGSRPWQIDGRFANYNQGRPPYYIASDPNDFLDLLCVDYGGVFLNWLNQFDPQAQEKLTTTINDFVAAVHPLVIKPQRLELKLSGQRNFALGVSYRRSLRLHVYPVHRLPPWDNSFRLQINLTSDPKDTDIVFDETNHPVKIAPTFKYNGMLQAEARKQLELWLHRRAIHSNALSQTCWRTIHWLTKIT